MKNFSSRCDQNRRKLWILSHEGILNGGFVQCMLLFGEKNPKSSKQSQKLEFILDFHSTLIIEYHYLGFSLIQFSVALEINILQGSN